MDWEKYGLDGFGEKMRTAGMNEIKEKAEEVEHRWDEEEKARAEAEEAAANFQSQLDDEPYSEDWIGELTAARERRPKEPDPFEESTEDDNTTGDEAGEMAAASSTQFGTQLGTDYRALFVGSKVETFIPAFNSMEQRESGGWNWPAVLAGAFWFVYRKMYLEGLIVFAITYAIQLAFTFITVSTGLSIMTYVGNGVSIIWAVTLGSIGNKIYWHRISRLVDKLTKLEQSGVTEGDKQKFIAKNSGTSTAALVIAIVLALIFTIFTFMIR